jgi:hypothetical protein
LFYAIRHPLIIAPIAAQRQALLTEPLPCGDHSRCREPWACQSDTKVYSTLLFVVAAIVSILLGFSPKFGALILSIPGPVIGGFDRAVWLDSRHGRPNLGAESG